MGKNQYRVPKTVYYQCIWVLKDMDRLRRLEAVETRRKKKNESVIYMDDGEAISGAGVFVQAKWKLECIYNALMMIPAEYRKTTLDMIIYGLPFDDMAHENTWRKWRHVFIKELAKNLLLV